MCRYVIEVVWTASSVEELMKELIEKRPSEAMERLKPYESLPFRYEFDAFESNIKQSDKKWIPSQAEYLPLQNVDVRNPHCRFIWMTYPSQGFAVLGRIVCEGGMQHVARDYSLKKRIYIGTTSMDAELSAVMANLALAGEGKLCMDPFCGTGSVLVALAASGAEVLGADLRQT